MDSKFLMIKINIITHKRIITKNKRILTTIYLEELVRDILKIQNQNNIQVLLNHIINIYLWYTHVNIIW